MCFRIVSIALNSSIDGTFHEAQKFKHINLPVYSESECFFPSKSKSSKGGAILPGSNFLITCNIDVANSLSSLMLLYFAMVSIISFIPLTMAWWGGAEVQKIGFLFIACFVVLLPLIIKSINDVSPSYLDVAKTKGASQWQLVKDVLIPVAMPNIWDHLRGVYGVGWGWIILAEVVNGQEGIGYLMSISERRGQTCSIFAIIIVIVVVATISDKIWKTTGDYLFPHRREA